MTVNCYLNHIASQAIVRDLEKESIENSVSALSDRLERYFCGDLNRHFKFGSANRGTMLPRKMDENSDVDYMIVFEEEGYQPQTYLDRLRRFAERKYSRSEIKQSNPTIILSLNHIHFELVPAIRDFWSESFKIPDKASSFNKWIFTKPNELINNLSAANKHHNYLIKPLIRILKYWNALNDYPFESYILENKVVAKYSPLTFYGYVSRFRTLEGYFHDCIKQISMPWSAADWKIKKLSDFKRDAELIKKLKRHGEEDRAVVMLNTLLPLIG